ncbi:MAG: response regulator, partial [Actinobacteria bacterium]|nr:response regulator [Actinomycetota bacterium]
STLSANSFWFTLPIADPGLVRVPAMEGPAHVEGIVLVVDSNPDIAELICTFLSNRGYHTCKAHSAEEAIRVAREIKPSLITLDVMLEDADGFELLEQLKEDDGCASIPILVVSVSCDEGKSLRLGANEYIEKPIDSKRLVQIADALVGQVASPVVLIVDDDRSIVGALSETLKRRGFAVVGAYDGAEAMAAVAQRQPDLILLDLMMPVMDGYEVIEALKGAEETRDIPIVVMTAHRIDQLKIDLVEMASERLSKPLLPEELAERVEELLLRRRE